MKLILKKEYMADGSLMYFIYKDDKMITGKINIERAEEEFNRLLELYKTPLPIPEIIKETEI